MRSLQQEESEPTFLEVYEKIQAELVAATLDVGRGDVSFVNRPCFSTFICIMVILNTLQMGLEVDNPDRPAWFYTENLFTAAFVLELVLKLCCLRGAYFHDKGNWLDGFLAVAAAVDNWCLSLIGGQVGVYSLTVLRILRMARLVRILRLVKACKRFVLILAGVVDAISTTCWVACLLGLAIYVCAIFCVGYLGKSSKELYPGYTEDPEEMDDFEVMVNFNPYMFFGSMGRAMLTLFNVAILAEWPEVMRPISEKQPHMVLFFIMFVLFVTFGIMNVIIGMIVDNVMSNAHKLQALNARKEAELKVHIFEDIKHVAQCELDADKNGTISRDELANSLENGALKTLLQEVNLPQGCSAHELCQLLDQSGEGALKCEEFIQGFYRLVQNDEFQSKVMIQMGIHHCKYLVRELQRESKQQYESMHSMFQAQLHDLRRLVLDMQHHACNGKEGFHLPVASRRLRPEFLGDDNSDGAGGADAKENIVGADLITATGRLSSLFGIESTIFQPVPTRPEMLSEGLDDLPTFDSLPNGGVNCASHCSGPSDRNHTHTDLRRRGASAGLRILRDLEEARRHRPGGSTAPCDGCDSAGCHEGYRALAGCLDAVCAEVQDAVWDTVRDTFTDWLASVERDEAHERASGNMSTPADVQEDDDRRHLCTP